jgi:hypothetical protein
MKKQRTSRLSAKGLTIRGIAQVTEKYFNVTTHRPEIGIALAGQNHATEAKARRKIGERWVIEFSRREQSGETLAQPPVRAGYESQVIG